MKLQVEIPLIPSLKFGDHSVLVLIWFLFKMVSKIGTTGNQLEKRWDCS